MGRMGIDGIRKMAQIGNEYAGGGVGSAVHTGACVRVCVRWGALCYTMLQWAAMRCGVMCACVVMLLLHWKRRQRRRQGVMGV